MLIFFTPGTLVLITSFILVVINGLYSTRLLEKFTGNGNSTDYDDFDDY